MLRIMKLHPLRITNNALRAADKLPERLKLLSWGDNKTHSGIPVSVGRHTVRLLKLNQDRFGLDRVAIDFEHNTVPGTERYESEREPRAVAGYGVPEVIEGEGLFLGSIVWTPHGEEFARDYCDLSPTVRRLDSGEVDFLHSVALTRAGEVEGLSFFSVELVNTQGKKGDEMDWRAFLVKMTGVAESVSDDELMQAFEAMMTTKAQGSVEPLSAKITVLEGQLTELSKENKELGGKLTVLTGKSDEGELTALSQTLAAMKDEIKDLDKSFSGMQRDRIVEQAAFEGKVIPLSAEQIAETSVDTLRDMVKKLTPTVPVEQRTKVTPLSVQESHTSSALEKIARTCGLDPKHVAEVNKG
jgi:hypothetical protein